MLPHGARGLGNRLGEQLACLPISLHRVLQPQNQGHSFFAPVSLAISRLSYIITIGLDSTGFCFLFSFKFVLLGLCLFSISFGYGKIDLRFEGITKD